MKEWFENLSVAVVGNSKSLFEKDYGNLIDSNDVVCRINKGINITDASSQGTRSDVWGYAVTRIVQEEIIKYQFDKTIHLTRKHRKSRIEGFKNKQFESESCTKFYYPLENLDKLCSRLGHTQPSSGLILINHILESRPKQVYLFGFDWKETPTWYFQEATTEHDWNLEKQFVEKNFLNLSNCKLVK